MVKYTYEGLQAEYQQLWDSMKVIRDQAQLGQIADKIKANQTMYLKVQQLTGVPWQLIAVIHVREAGLQDVGKFKGVLHNGEPIVGTNRRTSLVPAGRGPFSDWVSAAVDALKQKGFDQIKSWPVSRMLWALEPYNGYGYRNKGLRSPYLWASTNHQQKGKYVSDGVFNANVMDTQTGCAAMLKYVGVGSPQIDAKTALIGSGIMATLAAVWTGYWPYIVTATSILVIGAIAAWLYERNKTQTIKVTTNANS